VPEARARLLCLPCAGGGASMYRDWQALLPQCEVLAVQLPGREHRVREAPCRDLQALLKDLEAALQALPAGPPLVLFGHSLGALIAFLLARSLAARGEAPLHLFAAAARAPHRGPRRLLHDLPLPALLAEVARMGGTPPRVLAEPELVQLLEPALRADLWLAETNVADAAPRLPVPITALAGTEDAHVAAADVEAWREVAAGPCAVEYVRGGHFFLRDRPAEVAARLAAVVDGR
jgi:surfactin synthase thioesterase subunit